MARTAFRRAIRMLSQQLHPYQGSPHGSCHPVWSSGRGDGIPWRQQLIDHPDEFTDAEVIIDGGEDLPHQVIQHPCMGPK